MSQELADRIKDLSVSNNPLDQFNSAKVLTKLERTKLLVQIIKLSQDPTSNKELYELIINDSSKFLNCLKRIHDSAGAVIINTLESTKAPDKTVQNFFSCIRAILKDDSDLDVRSFYLGVYSSLVNHFKITNPQHLNLFLTFANPENDAIQRSILVLVIQDLKSEKEQTSEIIKEYLEVVSDEINLIKESFLNFVMVLEMCFPLIPDTCAGIYGDDKTKKHILNKIDQYPSDLELIKHVLKVIDASCILETCRNFNVSNYFQFLVQGCQFKDEQIRVLSCLIVVKLWKFIDANKKSNDLITTKFLADIFISYIKSHNDEYIDCSIEGLMYLTLYWEVRKLLRMDVELIEVLIDRLQNSSVETENHHVQEFNLPRQYSILSIFANLTKLKDVNDSSERANLLKTVATPRTGSESSKEDQKSIKLFNEELVNKYKILTKITKLKTIKGSSSTNALHEIVKTIYHFSGCSTIKREELNKQGAINVLLSFLLHSSNIDSNHGKIIYTPKSDSPEIIETRVFALRSLARMFLGVDPSSLFTENNMKIIIPFLKELLGPDISKYTGRNTLTNQSYLYEMTSWDKLECLRALTNISGSESFGFREYIVAHIFDPYLANFIVEFDDSRIQQASWELICNMIDEPTLSVKFFNVEGVENKKRLDLVLALLNSKNVQLQTTLAGLLANATEFDLICEVLIDNVFDRIIATITEILNSQTNEVELIHPVTTLLFHLVYVVAKTNDVLLAKLASDTKLKNSTSKVLETSKKIEVQGLMHEIMKKINFK